MPLYDFLCQTCEHIFEVIVPVRECDQPLNCIKCGELATKIITASGVYLGNDDAAWIKTVLEVVDKDSKAAHTQRFVKDPSRANYKAWMKAEGLRPLENNDRARIKPIDESKRAAELFKRHQKRNRIEI